LIALLFAVHADLVVRRAAMLLLGVELLQGVIGYTQYFTGLPPVLVDIHMLGACLVWIAAIYTVLVVRPDRRLENLGDGVDDHADHRTHDGAVEPDELKVTSDLEF
jgi:heme A synthase